MMKAQPSPDSALERRGEQGSEDMYRATAGSVLPTSIIGSLPRPDWYRDNFGRRTFREAMIDSQFREHYIDAVSAFLRDQETAGIAICTDGDCRFNTEVAGYSWFSYPLYHLSGLDMSKAADPPPAKPNTGFPRGRILHEGMEARLLPDCVGPIGRGNLQYTAIWKTAQRLTERPVKFGTITAERIALTVRDRYYKDQRALIMAVADALNEELHQLADAGCPAIQIEEPQIHLLTARGVVDPVINVETMVEVFNRTVRGLRDKTEVWCHSCWGNPSQQRMFTTVQTFKPVLAAFDQLDADVLAFETCSSGFNDLAEMGAAFKRQKIAIGVIDHHTLQVETPEEVAAHVRNSLKHIPAERLIVCTDCGMGREGMSRKHAFFKMVAMTLGANIVRREIGLPEEQCLAADPRYSMA
jgi:5-methyltetrahydropteroyltriglutamate--homocysteine methyltransferase